MRSAGWPASRSGALVCLGVLAMLAAPRQAAGQPERADKPGVHVYLSWVRLAGADSCPDVRQIADDVSRRLGWNPFREAPTQFIEAQIRHDARPAQAGGHPSPEASGPAAPGGTWVAEIFLRDASGVSRGNRIFTSTAPACTSLASVVSLSIAIIIDPDVIIRRFSDEDFWPTTAERAPPAPPPPASAGTRGALVVLGGAGLRLLPRVAPGMGLGGEVQILPRLSLRAALLILPEVRTPAPDDTFAFGLTAGWLGACLDPLQTELVGLGVCAGGIGGVMHAVVYFPDATHPGQRALWAANAGGRLALHLPASLELQFGADAVIPIQRREFFVMGRMPGSDAVFTQPAVAALLWGAFGVRFQ